MDFIKQLKRLAKDMDADTFRELVTEELDKIEDLTISERLEAKRILDKTVMDKRAYEIKQQIHDIVAYEYNKMRTKNINQFIEV